MKKILITLGLILALSLSACSTSGTATLTSTDTTSQAETIENGDTTTTDGATAVATAVTISLDNINDDAKDYEWDEGEVVPIMLDDDSISTTGSDVTIDGSSAAIAAAGTYSLSGTLTEGQIIVDTEEEGVVRLILDGVTMSSSSSAPIYVANAEKVVLVLSDGTQNTIKDSENYQFTSTDEEEPNAAIFSTSDLTIFGNGALSVTGQYNDGISSKDGLIIASGTIEVSAVDDGIRGKDYVVIKDGNITVDAGGDGIKSDNAEDTSLGFILVQDGNVQVTSAGDALTAETNIEILAGTFSLATSGGTDDQTSDPISAKAIKGVANVNIMGGIFTIGAADDGVHSNGNIVVDGGVFEITSADDGMHADTSLTINAGEINITDSYEGIESAAITINDGTVHVVADDDGINVAGGVDGSGTAPGMGGPGSRPQPGNGAPEAGAPGAGGGFPQDMFAATGDYSLTINGGYIYVLASGDGIDSNGSFEMTNGLVLVNGPTEQMNGPLDAVSITVSGGTLVAVGSAGMAMGPASDVGQNSIMVYFSSTIQAGNLVHIENDAGESILTFAPEKDIQSLVLSTSLLETGSTYTIFLGGSDTSRETDGLYEGENYSGGDEYASFTISSAITTLGSGGMGGGMGGRPRP